jgi:hypothetical protein
VWPQHVCDRQEDSEMPVHWLLPGVACHAQSSATRRTNIFWGFFFRRGKKSKQKKKTEEKKKMIGFIWNLKFSLFELKN